MDDPLKSVENTEKAREFWHEAVTIFKGGGFNLRKFRSNDEDLLREIADGQVQQLHKVLGVSWNLKSDELLPLAGVDDVVPKKFTKREVLSLLSKIYDPSGLVIPVVTPLKIIVQDVWKEKVGWDVEFNQEFRSRVEEVLKGSLVETILESTDGWAYHRHYKNTQKCHFMSSLTHRPEPMLLQPTFV